MFTLSIKKTGGHDYEPDSLVSKFNSVGRYVRDKKPGTKMMTDEAFHHSREVLRAKCKELKSKGKGNKPRKSDPFSKDDIAKLKASKELSTGTLYIFV